MDRKNISIDMTEKITKYLDENFHCYVKFF
jgi:hypothetical protein